MQTASFIIWTRVAKSTSYNDNLYATGVSFFFSFFFLHYSRINKKFNSETIVYKYVIFFSGRFTYNFLIGILFLIVPRCTIFWQIF